MRTSLFAAHVGAFLAAGLIYLIDREGGVTAVTVDQYQQLSAETLRQHQVRLDITAAFQLADAIRAQKAGKS